MILHKLNNIIKSQLIKPVVIGLLTILPVANMPAANSASKGATPFVVVIDPGHGGHDYGAVDNGANEKDINLGVAKKLNALLDKKMKGVRSVMTRNDDTFISLQERANIANRSKGDLFISIHTNSVDKNSPNRKSVAGANVYALGPQKDGNNLRVAQRENSVIELESDYKQKYSGFDPNKDESYIIFEMAQKKTLGKSLRFADFAQKELVKTAGRKDRGVKQAGFWVLWATSMPAVLVELDFICNPESAEYLTSDKGQQELAQSIYNAIEHYLDLKNQAKSAVAQVAKSNQDESSTTLGADIEADSDSEQQYADTRTSRGKRVVSKAPARNSSATSNSPRRRRSQSAKKASDERTIESSEILLLSEQLPVQNEKIKEQKPISKPESDSKSKSKSQTDKKNKKDSKNNSQQSKRSNHQKRTNQKTFVVKNNIATQTATVEATQVSGNPKPKLAPNANPHTIYYQIQLLASATEVRHDHPSFCGIVPTGSFVENGLYKYTLGRSESRHEIEKKLLEVKHLIPDAFIIVRTE